MKADELQVAPLSPCVRIFIESLMNKVEGTRCDPKFTLLGVEQELAVEGLLVGAVEDDT